MPRKVYNDATGKHVTKPHYVSVDEIYEEGEHVKRALTVKCPDCNAKVGEKCFSIIDASKVYEPMHPYRIEAARAKP